MLLRLLSLASALPARLIEELATCSSGHPRRCARTRNFEQQVVCPVDSADHSALHLQPEFSKSTHGTRGGQRSSGVVSRPFAFDNPGAAAAAAGQGNQQRGQDCGDQRRTHATRRQHLQQPGGARFGEALRRPPAYNPELAYGNESTEAELTGRSVTAMDEAPVRTEHSRSIWASGLRKMGCRGRMISTVRSLKS
jgi:hypothetical protein